MRLKAYMKNKFEFLGVSRLQPDGKLAKAFQNSRLTPSLIAFINEAWDNPYRELQHAKNRLSGKSQEV